MSDDKPVLPDRIYTAWVLRDSWVAHDPNRYCPDDYKLLSHVKPESFSQMQGPPMTVAVYELVGFVTVENKTTVSELRKTIK